MHVIPYADALARTLGEAAVLEPEWVTLDRAVGRSLAVPVVSPDPLPRFANSAMDGFALATEGKEVASGSVLEVVGRALAGDAPSRGPLKRQAWEIATGAPLPDGMDAVVPLERVETEYSAPNGGRTIRLTGAVGPGENVRREGEDYRRGEAVVPAGTRIGPVELMALSALGIARIQVRRIPLAAVLCTGDELAGDPATPLAPGQIRDSSGPFLQATLQRQGAHVPEVHMVGDEPGSFLEVVQNAGTRGAGLIVSTGAVSKGRRDFVPDALRRLGGRVLFHGTAIRPGKPILAGALPDGTILFGLPGNPISTVVGLRFFVLPYLRAILGRPGEAPWRLPLLNGTGKRKGFRSFLRARIEGGSGGGVGVRILPGQEAFRIRSLLDADAWAVLPEEISEAIPGTLVETWGLLAPLPCGEESSPA